MSLTSKHFDFAKKAYPEFDKTKSKYAVVPKGIHRVIHMDDNVTELNKFCIKLKNNRVKTMRIGYAKNLDLYLLSPDSYLESSTL